MRIFVGLTNIAGYYGPLSQGLEELGHQVSPVYFYRPLFGYIAPVARSWLPRLFTWTGDQKVAFRKYLVCRIFWRIAQDLLRFPLFIWAVLKHDYFIYSFGSCIVPGDLKILRLMGKKVVMIYHGSDSRPPFLDGFQYQQYEKLSAQGWVKLIKKRRKSIRKVEQRVYYVVNLPASAQFLTRPAISFLALGVPSMTSLRKAEVRDQTVTGMPVRILHCPSNPEAKGTITIRQIIKELKDDGHSIELVEVINQPNSVVHAELEKCDFVVDQLYSDTPLAGFATEAATYGKASIVAGYCQTETAAMHPGIALPPSCYCHPSHLKTEIENLILNEKLRKALGQAAKSFVTEHWNYLAVASRMEEILTFGPRDSWIFDPKKIASPGLAMAPEDKVSALLRVIIAHAGLSGLGADDKPDWQMSLLKLADGTEIKATETLWSLQSIN